ncbi:hypothetical protein DB88DRAFT_496280 [Papiliotrema laurentii]|uniref:Uncharacterized protein n=1 Tax=Papiliotrema laurentii TaxID=5418 RepID=A0AAD9CVG0_PAPLA|nr:hypothetical protein DB88DRAFT_496280 [Papiliotrema laurentii]
MSNQPSAQPPPSLITRTDLSRDMTQLLRLPASTLHALSPHLPTPRPTASALDNLSTFSPATASSSLDESQALIRSYIADMRGEVLSADRSVEESLAGRIDAVREEAQGLQSALGAVSV